ncbi:S8 family serine peptidase [Agrilutibacter solisilvae]|uniref:S8 family serine peptidase n=1 Tax=Agrilutibacter solisilvae TaxID=2763317 RepID=A0A975AQY5_9GAMM|nr:S8 family serine peptidase [Lysobacter solisilvae]QSX77167.1 S8 family serine peptidase [Lysobacter solisilvae]
MPLLPRIRASLIAAAILATPLMAQARQLDRHLEALLPTLSAAQQVEVIISFDGQGPLSAAQRARLSGLGLKGVTMQALPIAGALATPAQIRSLLSMSDVRSVWYNAPLEYDNKEATQITGVDRLRSDASLRTSLGLPYTGKGVGVVVNDSGVDGTHSDLQYPSHVVQNVAAQTNLAAQDAMLPITYVEGVANTDLGGGHGTHCAGIIGGSGASSPNGDFEGVAPGAGIVGYGSGAALFVLDTIGGFDYALTHQSQFNIRVISNSFGNTSDIGTEFDPDDPTNIATKRLADRGVVVVFSAGNSGPAEGTITGNFKKAPWVIAVAAGDKQGRRADFSSGGQAGHGGSVEVDGQAFQWQDRPTVTSPGVDIVSTRASLGSIDKLAAEQDVTVLGPALAVRYTHMSGTSMAAPHVAGIVALVLEANPQLGWREVKEILQATASNIPGAEPWEVGAGYVNAYAAVRAALGRGAFGATVNAAHTFNANALVSAGRSDDFAIDFSPVGTTGSQTFQVGSDVAMVDARAAVGDNTVALVLVDPNGKRYGSSIALPVLGENIAVSAPGVAGTWTVTVRGVGSVSGVALDPAGVTNGYGVPGTINVRVKQLRTDGYSGLSDIGGHAGRGFIEFAVANRLADSLPDGRFYPDRAITRGEMATYLTMGSGIRQWLPAGAASSFSDITATSPLAPYAEAVASRGAVQRDLGHNQLGVMGAVNGAFRPGDSVTRVSLAYSLVQGLGLQPSAQAFSGELTVLNGTTRIAVEDAASIAPSLRGYVQHALDLGAAQRALHAGAGSLRPAAAAQGVLRPQPGSDARRIRGGGVAHPGGVRPLSQRDRHNASRSNPAKQSRVPALDLAKERHPQAGIPPACTEARHIVAGFFFAAFGAVAAAPRRPARRHSACR